jgi:hypothetical protein
MFIANLQRVQVFGQNQLRSHLNMFASLCGAAEVVAVAGLTSLRELLPKVVEAVAAVLLTSAYFSPQI